MMRLSPALQLLRPSQWIKNGFVLAGTFFAGDFLHLEILRHALLAFAAFCLASSAIYALNDILDREADKAHPRKRFRPVASGLVSPAQAAALCGACAALGLLLAALISLPLLGVIALYLLVNVAYSRWLKHVVLVDVFCIASGFLLRLLAGTWGIGVPPSQWFVLCTFLLSLFLGFSKRYAERIDASQELAHKRAVVEEYSPQFLQILLGVTLSATLIAYGLYTVSPQTLAIHKTGNMIYSLPFAAFVMFRYLYLVMQKGFGENLTLELAHDLSLTVGVVLYALTTGILLFWG